MNEHYENKTSAHRPWKKALCILLSVIIAFSTFVTMTFGNIFLSDYIDFKSLITARADTTSVPLFYRYNELVGLYKANYTDNTTI